MLTLLDRFWFYYKRQFRLSLVRLSICCSVSQTNTLCAQDWSSILNKSNPPETVHYHRVSFYVHYCCGGHNATFLVDIISPISVTMNFRPFWLTMTGPFIDLTTEHLRKKCGEVLKLRHNYIYDRNGCSQQANSLEDMIYSPDSTTTTSLRQMSLPWYSLVQSYLK